MGFDSERTITIETQDVQGTVTNEKRSIPIRAVRISSTALVATKVATLNRTRTREDRRVAGQIRDWQAIAYACEVDAQRAADRHVGQYEAITHDLTATVERHDGPAKRGRGRPPKRPEPELNAAVHWRVR